MMDIDEIKRTIPHRYPFLLVDRVTECDMESRIVGVKNVTVNEPFFSGHFPGFPIMPGVLIIEAMAQVACILAAKIIKKEGHGPVFSQESMELNFGNQFGRAISCVWELTKIKQRGVFIPVSGQCICRRQTGGRVYPPGYAGERCQQFGE